MKLFNYFIGLMLTLVLVSCNEPEEEHRVEYPTLDSITDTLWYSVDTKNQIYYDITYNETTGEMVGYKNSLREEEVSRRAFSYTFTPATDQIEAIVRVNFEDGICYGGMLIPKGIFKVSDKDVYIIQLYEVDEKGEVIYIEEGKIKSSILMWRE